MYRTVSIAGLILLCTIVSACSHTGLHRLYDGDPRDPATIAHICIGGRIIVEQFKNSDSASETPTGFNRGWRHPDVLEVSPGPCRLLVSLADGKLLVSQPRTWLKIEARPGHSYVVGSIVYVDDDGTDRAWQALVIDKGTDYRDGVSPDPAYRRWEKPGPAAVRNR